MTLNETEDIATRCRREAQRGWPDKADLLWKAAEAIEWLNKELAEAEGYAEWLEFKPE